MECVCVTVTVLRCASHSARSNNITSELVFDSLINAYMSIYVFSQCHQYNISVVCQRAKHALALQENRTT